MNILFLIKKGYISPAPAKNKNPQDIILGNIF
jgi:hypothetical protein